MTHPQITKALLNPSFYPHPADQVELIQTHVSYIFLAGDYVYKVKKDVNYGFLDFTSLDRRLFYCREELRLNRRLAPDTYLEVLAIEEDEKGVLNLAGRGKTVEYALKMRRLPRDRMLKTLLKQGINPEVMDELAKKIALFHQNAATGGEIDRAGSLNTVRMNQEENFLQTEPFCDITIPRWQFDFIRDYADGFMKDNEDLFAERVKKGRIRECHGDLHLEHICLAPEIIIFDCIEFNERFRYADVAAEVAFLAMDLDYNGYPELAERFVRAYGVYSGDPDIPALLNFYKAYYAYVRGKVVSFRLQDPALVADERKEVEIAARKYFDLAFNYAARPRGAYVLVMSGIMGTGKSFLARELSRRLGAKILRSDVIRKELLQLDPREKRRDEYGRGIYSAGMTERTYEEMFARTQSLLEQGHPVILDASFSHRGHRLRAAEIARRYEADFIVIECVSSEETIRQRLAQRQNEPEEPSDGRWELYAAQAKDYEEINELPPHVQLRVDTGGPQDEYLPGIMKRLCGGKRQEKWRCGHD